MILLSTKQASKQNRTRDMEIKNKLDSDQRGGGKGNNGGKKGKSRQATCIKDPWTKTVAGGGLNVGGGSG